MKKFAIKPFIAILLAMCILLSGCASGAITQEQYDALMATNEELTVELELLKQEQSDTPSSSADAPAPPVGDDMVEVKIRGGFSATVMGFARETLSTDYPPQFVILTLFQSSPFILYVGSDVTAQLEVGNTYYFEIEEREVDPISREDYEDEYFYPDLSQLIADNVIYITSFREPTENELGLESVHIEYVPLNDVTAQTTTQGEVPAALAETLGFFSIAYGDIDIYPSQDDIAQIASLVYEMDIQEYNPEYGSELFTLTTLRSSAGDVVFGADGGNTPLIALRTDEGLSTYLITMDDLSDVYELATEISNNALSKLNSNIYDSLSGYFHYYNDGGELVELTPEERSELSAVIGYEGWRITNNFDYNYDNTLYTLYAVDEYGTPVPMSFITSNDLYFVEVSFSDSGMDSHVFEVLQQVFVDMGLI